MNSGKQIAAVISVVVVAMVASAWALGAFMGPTDNGMRCSRTTGGSGCEVLRTTFFGLFGNSSFTLPESSIRGAVYDCPTTGVGRRSSSCAVYLTVVSGGRQLVSSYALSNQAAAAAKRINGYLADQSIPKLEIDDSVATPILLYACLPVVIALLALGVGVLRRRSWLASARQSRQWLECVGFRTIRPYIFLLADGAISRIDPAKLKRDMIKVDGEDLVDVDAERAARFDHVWRRTCDTFYSIGYHGIDWIGLRPVYAKYLPYIGNDFEFAEMLAEMLGELNISHSEATYHQASPDDDNTASLGVFLDQTYTGVGNRKTGEHVLLTLVDGSTRTEVVVKPVSRADENRLLDTRWVKRNADEVDSASHGQLGYVHIPGMNDGAYRTTFEEIMGKYATRKGIVADTRFNLGGDLVADLAMFLSGKRCFDYTTDTRSRGYEPNFRWTKPTVAMASEANYRDGHCFAYTYKAQKLGQVPRESADRARHQGDEPIEVVSKGKDQQLEAVIATLESLTGVKP